MKKLIDSLNAAGGKKVVAQKLGITRQALEYWIKRGEVTPERVLDVESITGISRYELCPRVFGSKPE